VDVAIWFPGDKKTACNFSLLRESLVILDIKAWLQKTGYQFEMDGDPHSGDSRSIRIVFSYHKFEIPALLYIANVAGFDVLTLDTEDLLPEVSCQNVAVDMREKIYEWMLQDNDRNSLGNWGISPLGGIRFQVEVPISANIDVDHYMTTLDQVVSAVPNEIRALRRTLGKAGAT
jgi:hypothetical protein